MMDTMMANRHDAFASSTPEIVYATNYSTSLNVLDIAKYEIAHGNKDVIKLAESIVIEQKKCGVGLKRLACGW